jgi:hypothetical protein
VALHGDPRGEERGATDGQPGPRGEGGGDGERLVADEGDEQARAQQQGGRQPPLPADDHRHDPDGAGDQAVPAGPAGHPLGEGRAAQQPDDRPVGDPAARPDRTGAEARPQEEERHGQEVGLAGAHVGGGQAQPDPAREGEPAQEHTVEAAPLH